MEKNRILLADDSPVLQSLTKKILEAQGFHVEGIKTGKPVIDLITTKKIDLLILDIFLPDINGLEVSRQIRNNEDPAVASIPIIGISGNALDYSQTDIEAAGMNTFLLKPINYDVLLTSIKALLE